jgi:autoinducer 2-binding protein LuxP
MKYLAIFFFVMSSSLASEFIRFDEYMKLHEGQEILHNEFSEIVSNESVPLKIKQDRKVKISIVYPGQQVSDYWRRSVSSFKKRMDELNIKYEIDELLTKSSQVKEQARRIMDSLKQEPDYLIFTLDAKKHKRLISQILSKSKTKLILQNITTPLKIWEGRQPFLYVGFDHEKGSSLLIEHMNKKFSKGGSYAMLYFTDGYVSKMRGDTVVEKLAKDKSWRLVGQYYTDGNKEKTKKALTELTSREKNIDVIFTCATDIAIATAEFQKNNNLKFYINGWGGGSAEIESLTKKKGIDYTVMRINDDNGIAMAEAIKLRLQNQTHLVPQIFSGEMVIIDRSTSKEELKKLKEKAFRYSN